MKVEVATDKGLTRSERRAARNYEGGDWVRCTKGDGTLGLQRGAAGRIADADAKQNRVTVELVDGRRVTFDPHRVSGLSLARLEGRRFAVGDRIQFRAPDRERRIPNGQLGTIRDLNPQRATVELDGGRRVTLEFDRPLALDHGYASTSHAAQGQSVDRVVVCVDTERSAALVNQQQFYVSISRARDEALVFTSSRKDLARAVGRSAEKVSALDFVPNTLSTGKEASHGSGSQPGTNRRKGRGWGLDRAEPRVSAGSERSFERGHGASPRAATPADRGPQHASGAARRPSRSDRIALSQRDELQERVLRQALAGLERQWGETASRYRTLADELARRAASAGLLTFERVKMAAAGFLLGLVVAISVALWVRPAPASAPKTSPQPTASNKPARPSLP